jgi:hypothetical protein
LAVPAHVKPTTQSPAAGSRRWNFLATAELTNPYLTPRTETP